MWASAQHEMSEVGAPWAPKKKQMNSPPCLRMIEMHYAVAILSMIIVIQLAIAGLQESDFRHDLSAINEL
jgi:hypothetical protein